MKWYGVIDVYFGSYCVLKSAAVRPNVDSLWFIFSLLCLQLAKDLLHPSFDEEKRKCKLKRLVQSPNSYFMDVKCPGNETKYFNVIISIVHLRHADHLMQLSFLFVNRLLQDHDSVLARPDSCGLRRLLHCPLSTHRW